MFTFLSKDRLEYAITTLWAKIKNTFALKSHTHTKSQISDFPTSMLADGGNADTVNGFTVGVNVPADAEFHYTLPAANNTTLGGIQLGFTQTEKKYLHKTSIRCFLDRYLDRRNYGRAKTIFRLYYLELFMG